MEWFTKSLQPDYEESLYSKSLPYNDRFYYGTCSYFDPSSYQEISNIYKKGKAVPKDKGKAVEFESMYGRYSVNSLNKQKFNN